jgi:hypothetical protein
MNATHSTSAPRRPRWWVAVALPLAVLVVGLPIGSAVAGPGDTQAYRVIQEKLRSTEIDLEFEDAPVLEVFGYLGRYGGINIVIDQMVKDQFEADGRTVSLSLRNVTLGDAMAIVLDITALKMSFRNSVLYVTTPEQANTQVYMKLYDVRDLTFKIRDFPGPTISLEGGPDSSDPLIFTEHDVKANERPTVEEIIDLCHRMTALGTWDNGSASISSINGMLVVVQTAEAHFEIFKLLAMLRSMG